MTSKRKRQVSSGPPTPLKKEDLGEIEVEESDPSHPIGASASEGDVIIIDDDEEASIDTHGRASRDGPGSVADDQPLVGLDESFKDEQTWFINAHLRQPVATGNAICHLSDVPDNAKWNATNTLSTVNDRAIIIVAFGSLSSVNLAIARGKATTLSIGIDLFRDLDVQKLQSVYELAQLPHSGVSARTLVAHRTSADPRSRIMNVYDLTEQMPANPKDKLWSLGTNALLGGDVIRMDMRCARVRTAEGFRVQFKLKAAHLLLAVPRAVDILN